MSKSIVSYTIEIPSAMYRYVSGSGKAEIVFKDRNRVISYPLMSDRGHALATRLVTKGKIHITKTKEKNNKNNASVN
jgi:hypothetical protein